MLTTNGFKESINDLKVYIDLAAGGKVHLQPQTLFQRWFLHPD